jgi:predicted metal-dependent phosphoesterase TrpH
MISEKKTKKSIFFCRWQFPTDTETIEIKVGYSGDEASSTVTGSEKNVIDFALADENGDDIGASGSNTRTIVVGKNYASDGYKRTEPKGIWQIIVGCYQVKQSGSKVRYEVKFTPKQFRYLKGDLHMHTTNSDGRFTYEQLAEKARRKGLDFIFITDHNNSTEDLPIPRVKGLTVIEGLELTNYDGHINLLGVKKPCDGSYAVGGLNELNEKLMQAKTNGAMRILNHPFCHMCPINWDLDEIEYDGVEIWNAPANIKEMKAVDWWQKKLEAGFRIPIVGGSDYHRDYYITDLLASPTTRVWCNSNDKQTILEAVKNGHCVITRSPDSTMLDIRCGGSVAGDKVKLASNEKPHVTITVSGMKKGHKLQVFNQTGLIFEYTNKSGKQYSYTAEATGNGFVRAQIVFRKNLLSKMLHKAIMRSLSKEEAKKPLPELLYAITNPIYFETE